MTMFNSRQFLVLPLTLQLCAPMVLAQSPVVVAQAPAIRGSIGTNEQSTQSGTADTITVGKACTNFDLFTLNNQLLSWHDTTFVGSRGTILGSGTGHKRLHNGCLLVDTGNSSAEVVTRVGRVTIAPQTTAIIDAPARGSVTITVVGGDSRSTATLTPITKATVAKVSEQLVVVNTLSSSQIAEAKAKIAQAAARLDQVIADSKSKSTSPEVIASERAKARETAARARDGLVHQIESKHVDLPQYWQQSSQPLLPSEKTSGMSRIIAHINEAAQKSKADFNICSIATSNGASPTSGVTHIYANSGTKFMQLEPGTIALKQGGFFLSNQSGATISTEIGDVNCPKGSLQYVEYKPGLLRVMVCSGIGEHWIKVGKSKISLDAGNECMVADNHIPKEDIQPTDGIGRRRLRQEHLSNDMTAIVDDFSIISMMQNSACIKSMRVRPDKQTKRVLEDLLKTAAAIHISQSARGKYTAPNPRSSFLPGSM